METLGFYPLAIKRNFVLPHWSLGQKWGGDTPGDRIRQARITKGMTITDVSALTGLAAVSISNIEKNRRAASIPTFRKLPVTLDVPASFIGYFEKLPEASIAEKIKKARYYHCLTRDEMADRIGVNPRTIFDWESGLRKPLERNLAAIEKFLEMLR